MTEITGGGPEQMRLLAARIRDADPELRLQLRRAMRDSAKPLVDAAQQSILAMPAVAQRDLRSQVADTVKSQVSMTRTAVQLTITSDPRKMPPGKESLPAKLDQRGGFWHPVYARRSRPRSRWGWAKHRGKPGWFEDSIGDQARDVRTRVEQAMEATARETGG